MYRITALICSAVISATSILGAAFVPTLPYVPPADVQLFDLIYNTYGVTAPSQLADDALRLQGYLDLYARVLGAANEQFLSDIKEVFAKAKTGRKLEISATLSAQLMEGMKEALANGIQLPTEEEPIKDYTGIYNALINEIGVPSALTIQNIASVASSNGAADGGARCIVLAWPQYHNGQYTIIPYDKSYTYETNKLTISDWSGYVTWQRWGRDGYGNPILVNPEQYSNPLTYSSGSQFYDLGAVSAETLTVAAQSLDIRDKIDTMLLHPLTKYTKVENGVVDTTEPVIIDLPIDLPHPANVVSDLPTVQDDLGTVPISDNPAQTISQLAEQALAKYGDANEYALDLTRYFPFCLPFDIARILQALVAEPEAPKFSYTINNPFSEDPEDDIILEVDLAIFNGVAMVLRTLESIFFVVGLAVVTRSLYLRG